MMAQLQAGHYNKKPAGNISGFSLMELLITLAISGVVTAGIFTVYQSQQNSYVVQDQVSEIQQSIRAANQLITAEFRIAGYDATGTAGAGVTIASPNQFGFTADITGGQGDGVDNDNDGTIDNAEESVYGDGGLGGLGNPNEIVTIGFAAAKDADNNGIADAGYADLGRNTGGGFQPMAENVHAIAFAYAFDFINDGDSSLDTYSVGGNPQIIWAIDTNNDNTLDTNLDTNADGMIDANDVMAGFAGNGTIGGRAIVYFNPTSSSNNTPIANVPLENIRAVRIWLLAGTGRGKVSFSNAFTYTVGNKVITPSNDGDPTNDDHLMRLSSIIVKCRNLGMK
jgi:type IV pilus assembly protein PilW